MYKCPIENCGLKLDNIRSNYFKCANSHVFCLKIGNISNKEKPCKLVCYCLDDNFGMEYPVPCPPTDD